MFLYFYTGTEFRDFCEGACHYDVTEAKTLGMSVLNYFGINVPNHWYQNKHHTVVHLETVTP